MLDSRRSSGTLDVMDITDTATRQPSSAADERTSPDDEVLLYAGELGEDHPGFADPAYRERRAAIAEVAEGYEFGHPVPHVPYADEEHHVWQQVSAALHEKHREKAPLEIVESHERLGLPDDHVPQLDEVSELTEPLTGYRYAPVAGLVAPKAFYSKLAEGWFQSTQYIRHASAPFYTPEPDVIHEVIGHGAHLASDRFTRMYRAFGDAVARCETEDAVQFLSRFFWHTMEFGVVQDGGEVKAYGAGILSSVGELDAFAGMEILPWDITDMATRSYDITRYQEVLFLAESIDHLEDEWHRLVEDFDDDVAARHLAAA